MKVALLFFIIIFSFYQCRETPPIYHLDDIQGDWIRINSTDYRSDSMCININENLAIIKTLPNSSTFNLGQIKWTVIESSRRDPNNSVGDFTLYDLSSDGNSYESTIRFDRDTIRLLNLSFPNTLGGKQLWIRN